MAFVFNSTYIPSFIVNDIETQSLNGGITKKFTSLATNATMFRWKFGDGKELETTENPTYHTYTKTGTYAINHQTCIGPACCSGWCIQTIQVGRIDETNKRFLTMMGLTGFLFIIGKEKECEDYENKKECIKHDCEWLEKHKSCKQKIF